MDSLKIGIISRWNATCGVSMHAELIGNEFMKMGHELTVFAPYVESANAWWHHRIIKEDEDFVIRCYYERDPELKMNGRIDLDKVLSRDIDLLIVESYPSIPYEDIERIVCMIDAKSIAVIHEGYCEDIGYSDFGIFDRVVVFDERYVKEVVNCDNVEVIPYPCHPAVKRRRCFAEDVLTFFTFGRQPATEYIDYIKALDKLSNFYDFVYVVIRSDGLLPFGRDYMVQTRKRLTLDEVYRFLSTSDIHLIPKSQTDAVVVSSTLFQCLGSLVPTIVPNTRHFEQLPVIKGFKPVLIYNKVDDLTEKIVMLVEDENIRRNVIRSAEEFVEMNRSDKIAKRFLKLYDKI